MVGMENQRTSYWWWFDSHNNQNQSPWLQSTLAELDERTKTMLKLIEEDADSFARRAEMYYKKRPELISMVEDFYKTHRSLAEKYDLLKSESGIRRLSSMKSPFSSFKHTPEKLPSDTNQPENCCNSDPEDSTVSEVEDPEQEEDATQVAEATIKEEPIDLKEENRIQLSHKDEIGVRDNEIMNLKGEIEKIRAENRIQNDKILQTDEFGVQNSELMELKEEIERLKALNKIQNDKTLQNDEFGVGNSELMELKEEIERLKAQNNIQNDYILQKNEEKREVIRQLSLAVQLLKEENLELRNCISRHSSKKWKPFDFSKLKGYFLGKCNYGISRASG